MSEDAIAGMVFGLMTLALLVGGVVRIVWVARYDEYIGLADRSDPPPPSRFEVVMKPRGSAPGPLLRPWRHDVDRG